MEPATTSRTPRSTRWIRVLVAIAMLVAIGAFVALSVLERRRSTPTVHLRTPAGTLYVEVASTPHARAAGLANRPSIEHDGLLLDWNERGEHPIWMAEMRFPLDLVWLNNNGKVLAVVAHVPPCPRQPCPLYLPPGTEHSSAVLELPTGAAERHGIKNNQYVQKLRSSAQ